MDTGLVKAAVLFSNLLSMALFAGLSFKIRFNGQALLSICKCFTSGLLIGSCFLNLLHVADNRLSVEPRQSPQHRGPFLEVKPVSKHFFHGHLNPAHFLMLCSFSTLIFIRNIIFNDSMLCSCSDTDKSPVHSPSSHVIQLQPSHRQSLLRNARPVSATVPDYLTFSHDWRPLVVMLRSPRVMSQMTALLVGVFPEFIATSSLGVRNFSHSKSLVMIFFCITRSGVWTRAYF